MRIIYQVFYNYYAKDNEVDLYRWMSAGGLVFLCLITFGFNILQFWNAITLSKVGLGYNKGQVLIFLIPMLGLVYLYLLYIVKIERKGYRDNYEKYKVSKRNTILVWTFFWLNMATSVIIPTAKKLELL